MDGLLHSFIYETLPMGTAHNHTGVASLPYWFPSCRGTWTQRNLST